MTYIEGDTVRLEMRAEVVWQDENAVCVAVPDVDEPFIVPLRTDDGHDLSQVYIEPDLPDVRVGDVYISRATGFLWMAINTAPDELTAPHIQLVAQNGRWYDPAWVARNYGPLSRVVAQDQAADRPVMYHLPPADLPTDQEPAAGQHPEDLLDPLPETVPVDPTVPVSPLPDDGYLPPAAPSLPSLLPSASSEAGEVDETVAAGPMYAVVADADPTVLTVRTEGLDGAMSYVLPVLSPDAPQIDRVEVWAQVLGDNGWERVGGWRPTPANDGYRAAVRPAKQTAAGSGVA